MRQPNITPDEFKHRISGLGYSQQGFARYVEADPRSVRRWCLGEQDIPRWVPVMLRLLENQRTRPRSTAPAIDTRVPKFPDRKIAPAPEDAPT